MTNAIDDKTLPGSPSLDALAGPLQTLVASGRLNDLELPKKQLLASFLEYGFTAEAHKGSGITPARHYRWLRTDPVYAEACKALGSGLLLETAHRLDNLLPKAAEALEDALDAEKVVKVNVDVECPECGHTHVVKVSVPIADLKLRVDVAKSVLNRSGEMGTVRHKVEGKIEHETTTRLSIEDRQFLQMLDRGLQVPASVVDSLRQRGLLLGAPQSDSDTEDRHIQAEQDSEVQEAQYRVLEASEE